MEEKKVRLVCSEEMRHQVGDVEAGGECPECKAPVVEHSRELVFVQRIKRQALKDAPRPKGMTGPVRVKIAVCVGCGAPLWRGTEASRSGRNEVVVDDAPTREPPLCQQCEAIRYRYPEMYFWINNTAYWRHNRMSVMGMLNERDGGRPSQQDYADAISAMGGTPPTPLDEVGREPRPPYPPPGPDTSRKRKKVQFGKKKVKRGH
jgi:hypothetical protein